jgi:hypothetical protein
MNSSPEIVLSHNDPISHLSMQLGGLHSQLKEDRKYESGVIDYDGLPLKTQLSSQDQLPQIIEAFQNKAEYLFLLFLFLLFLFLFLRSKWNPFRK